MKKAAIIKDECAVECALAVETWEEFVALVQALEPEQRTDPRLYKRAEEFTDRVAPSA
jgi:hypothetical protein